MSSMRNAVHRRQHRERGQLAGREKWGILEKHKDYSLRAADYNLKKTKLRRLQEKASDRNPDEFAYGMLSQAQAKAGKHGAGEGRDSAAARGLSHDAIKLLKTQDAGYLRTIGERVRRQMERLREEVRVQEGVSGVVGRGKKRGRDGSDEEGEEDEYGFDDESEDEEQGRKKMVFADDRSGQETLKRALDEDDEDEDAGEDEEDDSFGKQMQQQTQKKSRKQIEAERMALVESRRARKLKKRAAEARANKLHALEKQHADITAAERELDWQRGRMENSVGGTNKNGLKWKIRERKK